MEQIIATTYSLLTHSLTMHDRLLSRMNILLSFHSFPPRFLSCFFPFFHPSFHPFLLVPPLSSPAFRPLVVLPKRARARLAREGNNQPSRPIRLLLSSLLSPTTRTTYLPLILLRVLLLVVPTTRRRELSRPGGWRRSSSPPFPSSSTPPTSLPSRLLTPLPTLRRRS